MAVIRVNKTANYTVMSNTHFKEREMSLKAKGLLSLMLSLPDSWDYSIAGLVAICKENETAIRSTLDELKLFGYLVITKKMPNETDSGRIEYEYDIYEQPHGKQESKKQDVENLRVDFQDVENHSQLNTKPLNTKKVSTENKINYVSAINQIVGHLNLKAGKQYKVKSQNTQRYIKSRLNEGFTVEDFIKVIDKKCAEWKGGEMERYLRPETLFGNKFEGYLNAPQVKRYGSNGVAVKKPDNDVDLSNVF